MAVSKVSSSIVKGKVASATPPLDFRLSGTDGPQLAFIPITVNDYSNAFCYSRILQANYFEFIKSCCALRILGMHSKYILAPSRV